MPCVRQSKSSTKRLARSGSRALVKLIGRGRSTSPEPRFDGVVFYGVRYGEPNPVVGDVVEWFPTRAEAEQAEVAGEPNPEDSVIARALSVVEVDFELAQNWRAFTKRLAKRASVNA